MLKSLLDKLSGSLPILTDSSQVLQVFEPTTFLKSGLSEQSQCALVDKLIDIVLQPNNAYVLGRETDDRQRYLDNQTLIKRYGLKNRHREEADKLTLSFGKDALMLFIYLGAKLAS